MQKVFSILIVGMTPALALAAGDHGAHPMNTHQGMQGHDMAGIGKAMHASVVGKPGDPARVSRVIEMSMDDSMRFTPNRIAVKAGETIRFFAKNTGKVAHELVIGSMDELQEHADMMRKMPDMKHAEPNLIALAPGQRGGLVWQFDRPGAVDFACLIPGHLEAGMVGKVQVE